LNLETELQEFTARKADANTRNKDYWLARQAMEHTYAWPTDWPPYKYKVVYPLVRKAVLTHANFLMGRGFTTNIAPLGPNPPQRQAAQKAEKGLFLCIDRCSGWRSLWRAAQLGSLLGTSGFKVYTDGDGKACFCAIQPEFIYPVPRGDEYTELVKVFYAYTVDRLEAERMWGKRDYKSERQVSMAQQSDPIWQAGQTGHPEINDRRIPVMEVWTKDEYLLSVGGQLIKNEKNPYPWIPYVVIPNIDSMVGVMGLSDVDALLGLKNGYVGLNTLLNILLSEHYYIASRYANPTLIYEQGGPNAAAEIAGIVGGGGALFPRIGSKVYYLNFQGQAPDIAGLLELLRTAGIDMSGLNELAWSGGSQGAGQLQTGPSLEVKFTNVLSTLSAKQKQWEVGLKQLFGMLLELASKEGDLGVADSPYARKRQDRNMLVRGKDVGSHRDVKIVWPGFLPKDDMAAARFELEKHGSQVQSIATTLENLGVEFPDDELEQIRQETQDENLPTGTGEQANMLRAQAAMQKAQPEPGQEPTAEPVGDEGVEGDLDVSPDEEAQRPADMDELGELPEGFGTLDDGTVVREDGNPLDFLSERLARARAEGLRERPPLSMTESEEDEEEALV